MPAGIGVPQHRGDGGAEERALGRGAELVPDLLQLLVDASNLDQVHAGNSLLAIGTWAGGPMMRSYCPSMPPAVNTVN